MLRSSEKSRPPTIKRTLEISGFDAGVSIRSGVVTLRRAGEVVAQVATIDIGVLIVDTPNATFTNAALVEIVDAGGLVILCGADHLPASYVLPVVGNELQVGRRLAQLQLPVGRRRRLWQQLVRAKVANQAVATPDEGVRRQLGQLARCVRSGDPDNVEAQAARIYWAQWLDGQPFIRDRHGEPPNNFLNYGYAVLRGVVARELCAAGFDPSFGLHHIGRQSGFPLADDFMEPLRPWVDRAALELFRQGGRELDRPAKARLLRVLYDPCWFDDTHSTVAVATGRMIGSFTRVVAGEARALTIPRMPTEEEVFTYAEKSAPPQADDGTETSLE
jgi:CRISPR-associated protein Cas1